MDPILCTILLFFVIRLICTNIEFLIALRRAEVLAITHLATELVPCGSFPFLSKIKQLIVG